VTSLSINLNKFALLRNSRGGAIPDVAKIARRCLASGASGVTIHPRPDQRHSRYSDAAELSQVVAEFPGTELNIEGAPSDTFLEVVLAARPAQCTLVPDAPSQLTSDHGWDVLSHVGELERAIARLRAADVRVSLFLDPIAAQVTAAAAVGAQRIELYTAAHAQSFGQPRSAEVLAQYRRAAQLCASLRLGVNAGHDLSLANLGAFLDAVPGVLEVSIGHAFVCECFDYTLEGALQRYLEITSH
jgi:pyridoxine 5-phosphate synthase